MRPLYALPAAALGLVLLNAFFGHMLYGQPYGQDISRYSVYVHLGEGWDSRPGNMLFEVTNVWSGPDSQGARQDYRSDMPGPAAYNPNMLQYQRGLPYVELRHEFSGCKSSWQPEPYRLAVDSVRAMAEYAQGARLNWDPYVMEVPDVPGEGQEAARSYAQFIPVCTSRDHTSYGYSVSAGAGAQFDVYFVDSEKRLGEYLATGEVTAYEGCHAHGRQSFGSVCDVGPGSGLLILVPDSLGSPLARITVGLHEAP